MLIYIYIYLHNFYFNFNNKNIYENNFWSYIEVLNNNCNSIILFTYIYIYIYIYYFFKKIYNIFFIKKIFYLNNLLNIIIFNKININFFKKIINFFSININLNNGLVLIHPVCIYITYVYNYMYVYNYKKNYVYINICIYWIRNFIKYIILYSFTALILGSWWAQQELNWGGWWNWDFVELIALLFSIISLIKLHTYFYVKYNIIQKYLVIIIVYTILFFILIRIDVLNSIHSFNSFSLVNTSKYIIFFLISYFLFKYLIKNIQFKKKYNIIRYSYTVTDIFFLLNTIFIQYIIYNIIYNILNNIQFVELTKHIKHILIIQFILLSVYYYNRNINIPIIFIIILFISIYTVNIYILLYIFLLYMVYTIYNKNIYNNMYMFHYIFILYVVYTIISLPNSINLSIIFKYNIIYINNNYIIFNNKINFLENYWFISKIYLNNFFHIFNKSMFFLRDCYVNNIIYYIYTYILYDVYFFTQTLQFDSLWIICIIFFTNMYIYIKCI